MKTKETTTSHHTRTDDDLFIVRMKTGVYETKPEAEENGEALMELLGDDTPLPILIDFSTAGGQDIETRRFYAEKSGRWCSRAAILVGSPVSRVMGNIYIGLNKPLVPTKLFTDEEVAVRWLKNN